MEKLYRDAEFVVDIIGHNLKKEMAIKAKLLEIRFFRQMKLYTKVKKEPGMRVITTKWLDINKGESNIPNYRSRLVGRELNLPKTDDLFAGTPPLESLRFILSTCASRKGHRVMAVDIERGISTRRPRAPSTSSYPRKIGNPATRIT